MLTGLASSLAYNFFFIAPRYTFTIQDPQNIITVLVLMGVAGRQQPARRASSPRGCAPRRISPSGSAAQNRRSPASPGC
ncbi:MAG: DUF4118 domain-containing protein [Sphingomonas sp.]